MAYTKTDDFKNESGKVDWDRYNDAQIANGERCYRCGDIAVMFGAGHRSLCSSCKRMSDDTREVDHDKYIRCPKCGDLCDILCWSSEAAHYEPYYEGEHNFTCTECEHDFTFTTHVSHSFTSPARIDEPEEDERDETDEDVSDDGPCNETLELARKDTT